MAERTRRGKSRQPLLGNHQKCWIWGRNLLLETLSAARWKPYELLLSNELSDPERQHAVNLAEAAGILVRVEPAERLRGVCKSREHQGYAAKMPPFPVTSLNELCDRLDASPGPSLVVVCDAIQDPYNFGAVIRSAEILGADGIVVGERDQVNVTSLVARTSAGAVNHLPIVRVAELVDAVEELRSLGMQIVAATEKASGRPADVKFRRSTALLLGNEGHGVRSELLELCDRKVGIPQSGRVGSLNVAVAAGVLMYEAARQRAEGADE